MIIFKNVTKSLGGRRVLEDLSFEVREGESFFIVGPSGTGKSVTLKHMVRLMTADAGSVEVNGVDLAAPLPEALEKVRGNVGYLFQGGALLGWLSVAENVALPLREKTTLSREEIRTKVAESLAMVGLEKDGDKLPSEISGGMRKRAGLARAIIRRPTVVLYDEPTSGLDPVSARSIDSLIQQMQKELGMTSVVVTHDLHSALSVGSRIGMLWDGKLVELAEPVAFIKSQNPTVKEFLESQYITRRGAWEGA